MKDIRIGQNIAALRKKNNVTQGQLAQDLHISPQAVSKWERGTCLPDTQIVPRIADYFHVSIDFLYRGGPVLTRLNNSDQKTAVNSDKRITTNMKAVFDRQKLLAVLTAAWEIAQTKNTIAAIDGLLFECPPGDQFGRYDIGGENTCRISAFGPEKGLRASVECEICEKGARIINADKILQIVQALPDGKITISAPEKNKVTVTGGKFSYEITAADMIDAADFPAIPMLTGDRVLTLPQALVRHKIEETVFAASNNNQTPALNGVLFRIKNGELTTAGCDGTRLAVSCSSLADLPNNGTPDAEMILPRDFLTELADILENSDKEATIVIGWTHVIFQWENLCIFTQMIQAEYMDYEKILPKTFRTQALVSRSELISAIERAYIVKGPVSGKNFPAPLRLDFRDSCIALSSASEEGSVHAAVPCTLEGEDITIGFHFHILLDSLKKFPAECDTLRIRLNDPRQGIVVESTDAPGLLHFMMPCRLTPIEIA